MELFRPFESLPLELVCRILCILDPRDVVRLRLVSKLFHDITHDPVIWKTIYANARLPRPPGPFPSQSTRFLEQTLIRSERLEDHWTTQPIQAVSGTLIQLGGSPLGHPRIVGGRWIITFESYRQIIFHDVETHTRQVLWEEAGMISSWDACSVASTGGLLVYVVLRTNGSGIRHAPWKLLEFRVHGESGDLSHPVSMDIPARHSGQSACLVSDKAPFLYIMGHHLVFDTRSRVFYEFPQFSSEIDEVQAHLMAPHKVLLTNTHIIVVSYPLQEPTVTTPKATLIQAFTLPADPHPDSNGTGFLRLSHEGIILDHLANLALTRNSTVDSVDGSTNLRFLRLQPKDNHLYFSCVDLTLPRSLSDVVPPVLIDVHDIFVVESGIYDPLMSSCGYYMEASDDGHARGFCRNRVEKGRPSTPCITKFTIDATGDKCVAAVGLASPPRWMHDDDSPCFSALSFDGVIGKFCYLKGGHDRRMHGSVDAVVVDIK